MAVATSGEANAGPTGCGPIEALFAELESPLLGYAQRLLEDAAMAQDVVQEAFLRLHAQGDAVREPRRWLYRTVHNLALNCRRRSSKIVPLEHGVSEQTELVDARPLPDEQIARWESIGLVRLGLENLDVRSRELVRLKFAEGLSYKEISERTGLTVGHVGYLLHHALKDLAGELARSGMVP